MTARRGVPTATPAAAAPAAGAPGRWPWPPLLKASVALHATAGAAALAVPSAWPWALGAVVADHALITAVGLWPRSTWLGDNLLRLPPAAAARGAVALTLDDGPDPEVTPRVLDLLDASADASGAFRATFFCIARRARAHPALVHEIVRRGHTVQNHSDAHTHDFSLRGPRALAREIDAAQDALGALAGCRPTLFRAPAGLRNPFLAPVLHARGLRLASWTRRGFDTRTREPARVLARLLRGLAAGDILLLHDGHPARTADGGAVVLQVLPTLLRRIRDAGLHGESLPAALDDRAPAMGASHGPTPASFGEPHA